jgi:hypothetical protein
MTFDSPRDTVMGLLPVWTHRLGGTLLAFGDRENAQHEFRDASSSIPGFHSPIDAGFESLAVRLSPGAL